MNADPTNPPAANTEVIRAQQELAAALQAVAGHDTFWMAVATRGSVTLTHGWADGSVDTMVIVGPHGAYATRENAAGREVWRTEGTAEQVDAAVRKLRGPHEPDAPNGSDHTPGPSGTWT